jgi:ABC-2 type transport system permease protein
MRSFAEEKKIGTIELLLTKPITDFDIIIGKFLATLALTFFAMLPTVVYVITLSFLGPVDYGTIFAAYVGLVLMAGVYISIGIFTSSLTENQIVAAILSFLFIFVLYLLNYVLNYLPTTIASILQYISTSYHFASIQRGVLDTRDIVYYLSGITIFLFLTRLSLDKRKW